MKPRPAILLALAAASAAVAAAADPATNELRGARFFLEKAGAWDEAAHAAFEAKGPAAAATAPEPRAVSAEEHAALWLDLVDFALADLAAPPPPDGGRAPKRREAVDWFGILRTRLPEPSQWTAVLRALDKRAAAFAPGSEPPLLAALRILFGGLADERPHALAVLEANFPSALDMGEDDRNHPNQDFVRGIHLDWARCRGFLARDLSDAPPDLSDYLSALRSKLDFDRDRDPGRGLKGDVSDLLLSLPDAELDALLDEWIEDEARYPDAKWRLNANWPFKGAPGTLARLRRRLLDRVRDGVPPELEGVVRRFASPGPCGYLEDEESEGIELLRLSLPFRVEAAAANTNANDRWLLSQELPILLERAERDGDGDEAERLRGFLARIGNEQPARPREWGIPADAIEIAKTRPFAEATAAYAKFWETRDPADEPGVGLPGLFDWLLAAQAADGREPANRSAIEGALPVIDAWLKERNVGPGCFCTDRYEFLEFVELLERLGRFAEAERRLWESIGTEGDWDDEEDVAPLVGLYARARRPQDVVDLAEGYRDWARQDLAELDSLAWGSVVPEVVRALADLGRTNEADRLALWFEISPNATNDWMRPFDPDRDPWEATPQERIDRLLECGFRGEALRVAAAAGLPEPPAEHVLPKRDPWSPWRFAPLDEFRETVREDVRKSAKAPLLPVPPVFPAVRIPVGDGGPALGGQNEIIRWTDRALPPAGVPDRFAPLFSRREPRSLRYPDWNGWPAALECLLRWNDRRDRFTSPH